MKKRYLIICSIILSFCSCVYEGHETIIFRNNTDKDIYIARSLEYPDTTYWPWDMLFKTWGRISAFSSSNPEALSMFPPYEHSLGHKILMVFVFDADTIDYYGWSYIRDNHINITKQRYDLSLDDLIKLDFILQFPPTEEMRDIKMWPLYGTYDRNGHRTDCQKE